MNHPFRQRHNVQYFEIKADTIKCFKVSNYKPRHYEYGKRYRIQTDNAWYFLTFEREFRFETEDFINVQLFFKR